MCLFPPPCAYVTALTSPLVSDLWKLSVLFEVYQPDGSSNKVKPWTISCHFGCKYEVKLNLSLGSTFNQTSNPVCGLQYWWDIGQQQWSLARGLVSFQRNCWIQTFLLFSSASLNVRYWFTSRFRTWGREINSFLVNTKCYLWQFRI